MINNLIDNTCEAAREYAVIAYVGNEASQRAAHLDELARRAEFVIGAIEARELGAPGCR